MAIISFENLASDNEFAEIPDGFRKLNWDNFVAIDDGHLNRLVDNTYAIRSGEAAGFTEEEGLASFKSPDRDDDFDLNSGYFTALNGIDFKVFGYDDGERVAKKVLLLNYYDQEFVTFGPQFDGIER